MTKCTMCYNPLTWRLVHQNTSIFHIKKIEIIFLLWLLNSCMCAFFSFSFFLQSFFQIDTIPVPLILHKRKKCESIILFSRIICQWNHKLVEYNSLILFLYCHIFLWCCARFYGSFDEWPAWTIFQILLL